jgi:DNA-binding NarL/FixJ family response regulator
MISVAIVEDNAGTRHSLEWLLSEAPGFRCVCACGSGEEALNSIPRSKPEVVLMDIHLPNLSGIECTARLKQLLPALQVIMITMYTDTEKVFSALRAGASGYLLKRSPPEKILEAIKEVSQGGAPMTSEIARKVVEAFNHPPPPDGGEGGLTRREQQILELLCQGFANKEIAESLSISFETVRWHNRQIYHKLHVRSRTEAAMKFRGGLAFPRHPGPVSPGRDRPE